MALAPTTVEADQAAARRSFWMLAASFALIMSFMTVPTPLYGLYETRDGFATLTVTLIYAAYAGGVIIGLFTLGHVSDHVGRRPVLLGVVTLEVASAVLFALFAQTGALLALRVLTGVGVGALSATVTAHLGELHERWRPGSASPLGRTVAPTVNLAGLAAGPIIAAVLSFLGDPLVVPYLVYAVAMIPAGWVVWRAAETVPAEQIARQWSYRPQTVAVDPDVRPAFVGAAIAALASFSVLGFVAGLAGRFLGDTLGIDSRLVVGAVATVIVAAAALSQAAFTTVGQRAKLRAGAVLVAGGMVLVALSALLASLTAYVVGGCVATAGVGLVFGAAVSTVSGLAAPERRSETLAAVFLAAYLGTSVPPVAIGFALLGFGTVPVTVVFALLVAGAVPIGIVQLLRHSD